MLKVKKSISRWVAFVMALTLICTGVLDEVYFMSAKISGNVSGTVAAEAATTGTVNADTFSWDNASVYFLLTDRFKNGNTSNDHSYNRGLDKNGNVIDVSDDRGTFHGGDFAGITQTIEDGYFDNLGINALWISAPYEQIHGYIVGGDGSPSFAHYSYHGYYVLDYTNTDANFGTEEEFKTLVDTAHKHGIRVVIDVVLNHAGYNSLYDMNEYGFGVVKDGWDDYYYSMSNVNNKDYHSYIDYEADAALWGKWWGPGWVRAGLPGYTEGGGDNYTMSLSGLPDFKTESKSTVDIPAFLVTKWKQEGRYEKEVAELKNYLSANGYSMTVTNCISYWLSTWVRDYGVDGFRCDTAKHVELSSWKNLHDMCTDALKEWKANNPDKKLDDLDFWMTGECWDHKLSYDGYYTEANFDSMINFDTTGGGVLSLGTVAGKYEDYAGALNTKDDYNVLSYMSSHDSTLARGDQVYLGSALLMLPGGVQVYYGDETNRPLVEGIDFDGNGGAGHSLRSDMNWDSIDEEVLAHWQKVGKFRNNHIAVGAGTHTTISATSGVGFTRTYSKNGISDRIAACIGASANTLVTLDVSGVWQDGSIVTNYYDNSSATVTNGSVTFNSGATGTILIGDPDGKPLVSIVGEAKFQGTQEVTIHIDEADYAIVSVDGAKKFIAHDGDKFTIGKTAYEGDTVSVSYEATNEKGTVNGKTTFYKAYADEDIGGGGGEEVVVKGKVRVKMSDGSAPYLYAWDSSDKALSGAWPGTLMTKKDSEGYYYYELDTTGTYNVIFNSGSDAGKTDDITNLKGETTFEVESGFNSYKQTGGTVVESPVNNTITIRIKPYSSSSAAPCLYVWNNSTTYNGGFPGKQLTEKDEDGNYIFVIDGVSSVNCIISGGSNQNQSDNITGITGEALITVNSADYKEIDVVKTQKVESKFELMKKEARGIKNMTPSDYTTASWNALYAYVDDADALVALGEETADAEAVTKLYNQIVEAKKALVLMKPAITSATVGSKIVKGTAAYGANVNVTINGTQYNVTADEVTGIWSVTAKSNLTSSSVIKAFCTRGGLSSATSTYSLSGGDIGGQVKGWKQINGKWYYYNEAGVMQTSKWINNLYYVKADGSMAVSEIVQGKYYVDSEGKWVKTTGWKKISNKWYYLSSGVIQTSKWISGKYYVKADGSMATSEFVDGGKYYVDADGIWVKSTKWLQLNGNWYYMVSGTIQMSKWAKVGTKWYYFNASGVMQKSKWISGKYYVKADGSMATSEFVDGGKYYVDADGIWVKSTKWLQLNGNWYYMVSGTIQMSKWVKVGTKWYYFNASGVMQKSKWISGKYYVKADGSMATSEWVDGGKYYVGADGIWVK